MEGYKQPPPKDDIRVSKPLLSLPVVRFGFTFLLGAFVGFAIFSFLRPDNAGMPLQSDALKGTFYDTKSAGSIRSADVLQYDGPVANALIRTRYNSKMVEITAELKSATQVKCSIQFSYNNFEVLNLQNISVNDLSSAFAGGNSVMITNVGENKFVIYLSNKNSLPNNIDVKLIQNDVPIYQNSLLVNRN